ncbi:MAG: hypothetical protein RQ826_13235, partial [Xanthomonadales bacterium]|nr:hypothetical protein [Xanthomonadales bacterium]
PAMGRLLARSGPVPAYVLCSSAVRARQTWAHVAAQLAGEIEVQYLEAVYRSGPSGLIAMIQRFPELADPAMIVGHNPVMQTLARQLTRVEDSPERRLLLYKFPTAALAQIEFEVSDWREVEPGGGRLVRFVRPRDLK